MTKKTAWSIIRKALRAAIDANHEPHSYEQVSAVLDHIAREADDAIQALAVAASGSPPSDVLTKISALRDEAIAKFEAVDDDDLALFADVQAAQVRANTLIDVVALLASSGSTGAP